MALKRATGLCDLHCHILPGIDDGSPDVDTTRQLLEKEYRDGVRSIIFTPHFYADQMKLPVFLENRERAFRKTEPICEELGIRTQLGAEVAMRPELNKEMLKELALGDTGYLLLEWPFLNQTFPLWGDEIVDEVFENDLRPVFAHIERYSYFFDTPKRLEPYMEDGVLCQMNATTVLREQTGHRAMKLIRQGYVHIIATDAHGIRKRRPHLKEAMNCIADHAGADTADRIIQNTRQVFEGRDVHVSIPKEGFFSRLFGG